MSYADRASRVIYISGEINNALSEFVVSNLLLMEADDPHKDIYLYIDSPGGSVTAGFAIYDTMQLIKPDVVTIAVGMAASMASILLIGGTKGKRYALPHAMVLLHQPLIPRTGGQATDIAIIAKNLMNTRDRIARLISERTGQPFDKVIKDIDRDFILNAEEAKEYGVIDDIIGGEVNG